MQGRAGARAALRQVVPSLAAQRVSLLGEAASAKPRTRRARTRLKGLASRRGPTASRTAPTSTNAPSKAANQFAVKVALSSQLAQAAERHGGVRRAKTRRQIRFPPTDTPTGVPFTFVPTMNATIYNATGNATFAPTTAPTGKCMSPLAMVPDLPPPQICGGCFQPACRVEIIRPTPRLFSRAGFDKYSQVFGVHIVGTYRVSEHKLLHIANVLARYMDNDQNSVADNQGVEYALTRKFTTLMVTANALELERLLMGLDYGLVLKMECGNLIAQAMFADDVYPDYRTMPNTRPDGSFGTVFDDALRSTWNLIFSLGYAPSYPQKFGIDPGTPETGGSLLSVSMDRARGGKYVVTPIAYPSTAWYHDTRQRTGCFYQCQATEYMWYLMATQLGALDYGTRCADVRDTWELCTVAELQERELDMYNLINDLVQSSDVTVAYRHGYSFPTVLPNGTYRALPASCSAAPTRVPTVITAPPTATPTRRIADPIWQMRLLAQGLDTFPLGFVDPPLRNGPHSVMLWLKFPRANYFHGTRQWLFSLGDADAGMAHWLWNGADRIQFGAWGSPSIEDGAGISDDINAQVLVATYNGNGIYRLYKDSVLKHSVYSTVFNIGSNPQVTVGQPRLGEDAFQGEIYQVKIWDVTLQPDEVAQVTEYSNIYECLEFPTGECGKAHYTDILGPDLRPMPCFRAACCNSLIQQNYVLDGSTCQCTRRCAALFAEAATYTPTVHYCRGETVLREPSDGFREAVGLYREDMSCSWLIQPERSPTTLTLEFTQFVLESQYDVVKVYEGWGDGRLLASFTGEYEAAQPWTMPGPVTVSLDRHHAATMRVTFTSDSSVNLGGFHAQYF